MWTTLRRLRVDHIPTASAAATAAIATTTTIAATAAHECIMNKLFPCLQIPYVLILTFARIMRIVLYITKIIECSFKLCGFAGVFMV